jgi:hypothetical protein
VQGQPSARYQHACSDGASPIKLNTSPGSIEARRSNKTCIQVVLVRQRVEQRVQHSRSTCRLDGAAGVVSLENLVRARAYKLGCWSSVEQDAFI